jgi:SAM-dependent methyltransferase
MSHLLKSIARKYIPLQWRIAIASRLGRTNWYRIGDGITFREAGFVAAQSPATLLVRHNFEVRAIARVLDGVEGDSALEIGCGYGRLSPTIAQFAKHFIAIDHNPEIVETARAYYRDIDYRVGSAVALPFEIHTFDIIVSWTVLQHVPPQRIGEAVVEIQRVLNPGGILVLCEETRLSDLESHHQSHTWHRSVEEYRLLFSSLDLEHDEWISELEQLEGIGSPGRLMTFRKRENANITTKLA